MNEIILTEEDTLWPTQTDNWCWWCCHPFETRPVGIPQKYDERTTKFKLRGNFCSWNCAKSYNIFTHQHNSDWGSKQMLLTLLIRRVEGKTLSIKPAAPRQLLRVFGGNQTIEEFRKAHQCATYELNYGKLYVVTGKSSIIQTPTVAPKQFDRGRKDELLANVSVKNQPLRLQRSGPKTTKGGIMESFMKSS